MRGSLNGLTFYDTESSRTFRVRKLDGLTLRSLIPMSEFLIGHDIRVNVKLQQTSRYKSVMVIFRAITCRASKSEET